jgi:hypothetical protein
LFASKLLSRDCNSSSEPSSMNAYGLFSDRSRIERFEPEWPVPLVDVRLRKREPRDNATEFIFSPVFSLCSRASDGMQLVDIPTHISRMYVR